MTYPVNDKVLKNVSPILLSDQDEGNRVVDEINKRVKQWERLTFKKQIPEDMKRKFTH